MRRRVAPVIALVALAGVLQATEPQRRDLPPLPDTHSPTGSWCGTRPADWRQDVSHPRVIPPDGQLLWFQQEPSLLSATHTGGLRFSGLTVAGDVPQVRFARYDRPAGTESVETWTRTTTATVNGSLVSVFDPTWDPETTAGLLRYSTRGVDVPASYFGRYLGPDDGVDHGAAVSVRLGVTGLPPAAVTVISPTVQYASHVVNLVLPDFSMGRIGDDHGFDLENAAQAFYRHFEDTYEILSFIPLESHPASYAAFHLDAQNAVLGTGSQRFNRSSRYGSDGRLLGVEVYADGTFASNRVSNHELTHTWGHDFDWMTIAGIATADHAHSPLMTGGESIVSNLLRPWFRVAGTEEAPTIELTPVYAHQHPLELYAMGLIEAADVPPMRIFTNQFQFEELGPYVGALLDPSSKVATIDDVRRVHGPREGPAFAQIRRAAIVVSRDRLLTADEMAYWNYVAARQEDPNRSGMFDYDGQPSFEFTTGLRTDLATAIRPRDREPSTSAYVVDSPPLDPRECVGILFDAPVQTRFTVGQRVRLSGRVTATDRTDFDQILLRYWPRSGSGDAALRAQAEVSRSGMFSLELEFREAQKGLQRFEVFLFWPNASPQHPRCSLTTVTVDGTPGPASTAVATGR